MAAVRLHSCSLRALNWFLFLLFAVGTQLRRGGGQDKQPAVIVDPQLELSPSRSCPDGSE